MNFNVHSHLDGLHAFLGASNYYWLNYDEEKLSSVFLKYKAAQKGTALHDLAKRLIDMGVKLPRSRKTLDQYVNDAIGFQMQTEVLLYYSDNCFGTVDAISFKKRMLRIHDLKTGESPTSMNQLLIYTALFCLEYAVKPVDIEIELRIYQSDDVKIYIPTPEEVINIMNKIIINDKKVEELKARR